MAKRKWTQQAAKSIERRGTEGSFRAWCQRRGHGKVTAECIAEGLRSKDPGIRKKAGLAKAYAKIRPKGKKKRGGQGRKKRGALPPPRARSTSRTKRAKRKRARV